MNYEEMREYLLRMENDCCVYVNTSDGGTATVSHMNGDEEFVCSYKGKGMETKDVDKALRWLWNRKADVGGMCFVEFQKRINKIIERAGGGITVRYKVDREKGRHFAFCSDGSTIIGNTSSLKVAVRWGSDHAAVAEL